MKSDKLNVDLLHNLINLINDAFDKNEDLTNIHIESLYQYVSKDNLIDLLDALNKVKKSNINKARKLVNISGNTEKEKSIKENIKLEYSSEDVFKIFNELSDEDIEQRYKLVELKSMYFCLYSEIPSKSKRKCDIIDAIRNYIYTSNRANAFKS